MIILDGVTKIANAGNKKREVLRAARVRIPADRRIAILGPHAGDKKIFIDLLAGVVLPSAGRIVRKARVSFPAGHLGGFARELPVHLNVAHVARLYGADVEPVVRFVAQVSKLGDAFNRPYGELENAARRDLSEILAFSIPFDVYLLTDDVVRKTMKRFNKGARALFEARAKTSGMIIASQDAAFAREFCDMALVLKDGELRLFKDMERAIAFSERTGSPAPKEQVLKGRHRHKPRDD